MAISNPTATPFGFLISLQWWLVRNDGKLGDMQYLRRLAFKLAQLLPVTIIARKPTP